MRLTTLYLFVLLSFIGSLGYAQKLPSWCDRLSGANLKEAVKINSSPKYQVSADKTFDLNFLIEETNDSVVSLFSNNKYPSSLAAVHLSERRIVPEEWFRNGTMQERQNALEDMMNIYPCESTIIELLQDNMPGNPISITWTNGVISIGADEKGEGVWSFPEAVKGEFARVFFYMATIYPMDLWGSRGILFMSDGAYPSLSERAMNLLLEYHYQYPPTSREIYRNKLIEEIQGNRNPFVDYPELANLIWHPEETDENPSESEDDVVETEEKISLKGFYDLNEKIWLLSPFISMDAKWKIDGIEINEEYINASELGKGKHLLEYTSERDKGKLFIEIVE